MDTTAFTPNPMLGAAPAAGAMLLFAICSITTASVMRRFALIGLGSSTAYSVSHILRAVSIQSWNEPIAAWPWALAQAHWP